MQLNIFYFFIVGYCIQYSDGGGHEKHVKVQIPKLVHKHKHHVVVHEKGGHDDKKHIVIHKHEHKHHHKHDHGHKHGHKHEAKHSHKHSAKHSHKHEAKHSHKHEAKHQHKHQAKHSHKHEAKHSHKHEAKHSHKHKHSHKSHGKHEHNHKHHGKHDHKHKHAHKHSEKHGKHHEKLVVDLIDDHHSNLAAYSQDVGQQQEYSYAPYQAEGDYEEYQQLQNEEQAIEDDDHDNLENYDDFDSPSENIENYDDTDVDFLNAKKTTGNYQDPYNYNSAIIGEVLKNTYANQESPLAIASNKVIKQVSPDPFAFDDDSDDSFGFTSGKSKLPLRNKKYESIKSGSKHESTNSQWVPITNNNAMHSAASYTVERKIPVGDASAAASSTSEKKVPADYNQEIISSTSKPFRMLQKNASLEHDHESTTQKTTGVLEKKRFMKEIDPMKVVQFQSTKLIPKTTLKPTRS